MLLASIVQGKDVLCISSYKIASQLVTKNT